MTTRAVLYARVSGDDRGNDGRNLQGQLDMCREYAQAKGYTVIAELAEDDRGASGASWDLPQLNRALEMARAGEFDVLVVRELDRLSRDIGKLYTVESELKHEDVKIEYVLYDFPDTPEGQFQKNIRASLAAFERDLIKARMARGRYNKVKAGSVIVNDAAPYGYKSADLENGHQALEVYEPEARVVRMIFEWCVKGDRERGHVGQMSIAKKLTDLGIPTRKGRGIWATSTVQGILRNKSYYGCWEYGKTSDNHEPVTVAVPAIIDRETWERAQEQRKENRRNAPRRLKYEYLVRNFITCGHCQATVIGRPRKLVHGVTLYYRCASLVRPCDYVQRCDNEHYYRVDVVDAAIWAKIKEWTLDEGQLDRAIDEYQAEKEQESAPYRARLAIVDDLLRENQEQLTRLLDLYLAGDFPKEMLTERKHRLEETAQSLQKERASLATALEAHALTDEQRTGIKAAAAIIRAGIAAGDQSFENRRRALESLRPSVTLYVENGHKVAWLTCAIGSTIVDLDNVAMNNLVQATPNSGKAIPPPTMVRAKSAR